MIKGNKCIFSNKFSFKKYCCINIPFICFSLLIILESDFYRQEILNLDFTTQDIIVLVGSAVIGVWYFLKKHWVANNLFGLAFAINGVELLHLNKVVTGCILLGGLFFYDIFWVFGTNVMVTVAKSFEAPIKLVFPQDLLENGLAAQVSLLSPLSNSYFQ